MLESTNSSQVRARAASANPQRSNQDWLRDLCGQGGPNAQQQAHLDLGNYLYVVAYNYLLTRQVNIPALSQTAPEELAALAQDFVQDTLEKLAADQFARLHQYRETGRFTSWAAQIIHNQIAGALRKASFTRQQIGLEQIENQASVEPDRAVDLAQQEAATALQACINQLPEHYRIALVHCIAEGQPAQKVAVLLQRNVDAVYLLVMRAKRQVKQCLKNKGFNKEVLDLFP